MSEELFVTLVQKLQLRYCGIVKNHLFHTERQVPFWRELKLIL